MARYRPTKTTIDGIVFASRFESQLYLLLKKQFFVSQIICQPKIVLIPKTKTNLGQIYWKPDFAIDTGKTLFYFEAKGDVTETFSLKLRILSDRFPEIFEKCFFVFHDQSFKSHAIAKTLAKNNLIFLDCSIPQAFDYTSAKYFLGDFISGNNPKLV